MNFIYKYSTVHVVFLLLFLLPVAFNIQSFAAQQFERHPAVYSYQLKDYNSRNPVKSLMVNDQGIVIACGRNQLTYLLDNVSVNIPANKTTNICKTIHNQLYFTTNDFICRIENGQNFSQIDTLTLPPEIKSAINDSPKDIKARNDNVFVVYDSLVVQWKESTKEFLIHGFDYLLDNIFASEKGIYIQSNKNSFWQFGNDSFAEVKMPFSKNDVIIDILDHQEETWFYIKTPEGNKVINRSGAVHPLSSFVNEYDIADILIQNSGLFFLATRSDGLIILDSKLNKVNHLQQLHGLPEDKLSGVSVYDTADNIVVWGESFVSILNFQMPYQPIPLKLAVAKSIIDFQKSGEMLYLALAKTVWQKNLNTGSEEIIFRTNDGTTILGLHMPDSGNLFVIHTHGITNLFHRKSYKYPLQGYTSWGEENQNITLKTEKGYINLVSSAMNAPETITALSFSGDDLFATDQDGNIWVYGREVKIWMRQEQQWIYPEISFESQKAPLPENIIAFQRSMLITYPEIAYIATLNDGIVSFSHFSAKMGTYLSDNENNTWSVHSDKHARNLLNTGNDKGSEKKLRLPAGYDREIKKLFFEENGDLWIHDGKRILHIDHYVGDQTSTPLHAYLTHVIMDEDSILHAFDKSINNQVTKRTLLPRQSLTFRFSSNDLSNTGGIKYNISLKGSRNRWETTTTENKKIFMGLRPGSYLFEVSAQNIKGETSPPVVYAFVIPRPLYFSTKAFIIYALFILIIFLLILIWRSRSHKAEKYKLEKIIDNRTRELMLEKQKSEELLANVLPKNTANELMARGKATSRKYRMATVLFSDIQGFTKIAEHLNPETLVDQLDSVFFYFDQIVGEFNIEKIKTIGDAYMCAGGIPEKNRTNPVEVVLAALEMQRHMEDLKESKESLWDLRIGIHTGSIIAGVLGQKKLSYDIWGDTVNTASRMESSGEPGKINISGETYEYVKDFFICEYRGKMPVKYKGEIDMYFVKGIRPELTINLQGTPNQKFEIKLQALRLLDLEEEVLGMIEEKSHEKYDFHNMKYAIDIYTTVELLARAESLSKEETLLAITAGLLLITGRYNNYKKWIDESAIYARNILQKYKYSDRQIEIIVNLINSLNDPFHPKTLAEKIICDACYMYIGRSDYPIRAMDHFREYNMVKETVSLDKWKKNEISFMQEYAFHTNTARVLREMPVEEQVQLLKVMKPAEE